MHSAVRLIFMAFLMCSIGGPWSALQAVSHGADHGLPGQKKQADQGHGSDAQPSEHQPVSPVEKLETDSLWQAHGPCPELAAPRALKSAVGPLHGTDDALASQWQSSPPTPPPRLAAWPRRSIA